MPACLNDYAIMGDAWGMVGGAWEVGVSRHYGCTDTKCIHSRICQLSVERDERNVSVTLLVRMLHTNVAMALVKTI